MEALDEWNTQQIAQKILPIVRECCGNVCSAVIPQETPGVIAVTYPRNYESSYIRPRVLLEIGPKAAWNPHAEHTVRPYMAEVYPHLFHGAETSVVATTAERAFWEKITILHSQAPGAFGAYLRITIYELRFGNNARRRRGICNAQALVVGSIMAGRGRWAAPIYDLRITIYDMDASARCAGCAEPLVSQKSS